ncbi:MAG TPA: response regulator [Elusimicrobiota bacterium]|nr:response regulator [Elusimicrobiota bacterium]
MKKILVADDSLFMRTAIKDALEGRYAIVEADSGLRSLEQFERARPDLTLLDVVMPEGDETGLHVLRRIMAEDPAAKVVMITALGPRDAVVAECLKAGAKGCVVKPFEKAQLREVVAAFLG